MGGVVSAGRNNDDLIDNLIEATYIRSSFVEKVFRAVDRAEYYLADAKNHAYRDLAWKNGNLHLSAPCIYSEVMEGLCLEPGLSFLNLGSGTGYLSTMVGLVLGSYGINHGIEYYPDVVQYANKRLEDFRKFSGAIDEFDYCEPKFIQGNCLCLTSDCNAQYDRVYCGAACPDKYTSYMKNLLKVGGILVMPLNDQLLQIKRTSETNWDFKSLLPVSFASLISPPEDNQEWVQMIEVEPLSLQCLCRSLIRNILRKNVEVKQPPVKKQAPANKVQVQKKKRFFRRMVVPLFESDDSSDEDRLVRFGGVRNRTAGRATFREPSAGILNFVLGTFREGRNLFSESPSQLEDADGGTQTNETEQSSDDNRMETDTAESNEELNSANHQVETRAVIEHNPGTSQDSHTKQAECQEAPSSNINKQDESKEAPEGQDVNSVESINTIFNVFVGVSNVLRDTNLEEHSEESHNSNEADNVVANQSSRHTNGEYQEDKKKKKREKFDSGLGDEIVENHSDESSSDEEQDMNLDVVSGSEVDRQEKRTKRGPKSDQEPRADHSYGKWRRIGSNIQRFVADSSSGENENEEEVRIDEGMRMYESSYTEQMKAKIQDLPLPPILKRYLNFYREF